MKAVTVTGEWIITLQLPHERAFMVKKVFDLAKADGWTVRVKGEHWT